MERKRFNTPVFGVQFILVAMALYFVLSYIARAIFGVFDIEHVGATEILTYLFYGFGGGIIFCCAKDYMSDESKIKTYSAIVFLYIIMIFRDMGAQGWLTTHDTVVTKIRFFTSPTNPLYEKIIAGAIMLFIVLVFLYVLIKNIKTLTKGIINFEPVSWTSVTMFIWMIITQIVDRFPAEYCKATGVELAEPIRFAMKILEEGGESLLPLLIAIAFLQYRNALKNKEN
ncbi:MAG: hypothetical protein E7Z89_05890 [Cyanobacteria bacterium SIG28]|nr:hypothetical protein [Cyanobacteria bacterium SIG28]